MSMIIQGEGKLKEVIIVNIAQIRLCQLSNFGWSIIEYIYAPQRVPKEETWASFMEFLCFSLFLTCESSFTTFHIILIFVSHDFNSFSSCFQRINNFKC